MTYVLSVPDPEAYFLTAPLYEELQFRTEYGPREYEPVLRIEFFIGTLDTFCRDCGKNAVFWRAIELPTGNTAKVPPAHNTEELMRHAFALLPAQGGWQTRELRAELVSTRFSDYAGRDRYISHEFRCSRDASHVLLFFSRVRRGAEPNVYTLTKIGQDPSLADLQLPDYERCRKLLGNTKHRELKTGVGLASHGVGIGAFVYLRRVFETLVENAHSSAQQQPEWDDTQYAQARMDRKIQLLKEHLPEFLVDSRGLYGILSKGVHELDEQECLEYLKVVKVGIELILDEELDRKRREERAAATRAALGSITRSLRR